MRTLNLKGRAPRVALLGFIAFTLVLALPFEADADWKSRKRDRDRDRNSDYGELVTQERDVKDFSRVKVKGIADVEILFGTEFKVEVEAYEEVIDDFETDVSGRTLTVGFDTDNWDFDDFTRGTDDDFPLKVRITMPDLAQLGVKGIGSVEMNGFRGDELEVHVSGVGSIDIRDFQGKLLELSISGVSDIQIDGTVDELDVTLTGVGDADLKDLIAKDVYAVSSGLGNVTVHATESIDAKASGFGDVIYYGNPEKVRRSERGFGDVVAKR